MPFSLFKNFCAGFLPMLAPLLHIYQTISLVFWYFTLNTVSSTGSLIKLNTRSVLLGFVELITLIVSLFCSSIALENESPFRLRPINHFTELVLLRPFSAGSVQNRKVAELISITQVTHQIFSSSLTTTFVCLCYFQVVFYQRRLFPPACVVRMHGLQHSTVPFMLHQLFGHVRKAVHIICNV